MEAAVQVALKFEILDLHCGPSVRAVDGNVIEPGALTGDCGLIECELGLGFYHSRDA